MGFTFYPLDSLPNVFDIVWCKWPNRGEGLGPGPVARPVLVLDVDHRDFEGQTVGALTIQYGGRYESEHLKNNLHLSDVEARALTLHKTTVFRLDVGNRQRFPWCKEYFDSQQFVANKPLIAGSLPAEKCDEVRKCLAARRIPFPFPKPKAS